MSSAHASELLSVRLAPGADLRRALEQALADSAQEAAFVVAGIGSLHEASVRYAGAAQAVMLPGPWEILSLSGSLSVSGAHLHVTLSDASGSVCGGHLGYGSTVRTTAEVLIALLPDWTLTRAPDAATGFDELVIRRRAP